MEIVTSFYFGTQKIIFLQLWGSLQGPSTFCHHHEAFDDTINSQKQICQLCMAQSQALLAPQRHFYNGSN